MHQGGGVFRRKGLQWDERHNGGMAGYSFDFEPRSNQLTDFQVGDIKLEVLIA